MRTPKISLAIAAICALMATMIIGASPAQAADCLFTNDEGDFQWENSANWSCGRVPIASDTATINTEARLSRSASVRNLTLEGEGRLIPDPSGSASVTLTVTGNIEWTGGSIGWDGRTRIIVDWQSATGTFVISGSEPKAIYRTGRVSSITGGRAIEIREEVSLEVESFADSNWSLFSTGPLVLGNDVSLTGEGWVHAQRLIVDQSAFVSLERFSTPTVQLGNSAELSVSGGKFWLDRQGTVTGDPAAPALDGGRLITGAPLPGQTDPNPTTISAVAQSSGGSKVTQGTATWEHLAGQIAGKITFQGTPTSMPFVWSGGDIVGELVVGPQASLEAIGDTDLPLAVSGPSGKLTVQGDVEIAESTKIDLDLASVIAISPTGKVNQYSGSEINGTASGANASTITNNGTWSAYGGTGTVVIRDTIVRGAGTWERTERPYFDFRGTQPVDLGNLATKVANNYGTSAIAAGASMTIRKLSVTSGAPSTPGTPITIARAQQLNTSGMTTSGLAISPTLAFAVSTVSNTLSLTVSAAVPLTLECLGSCPTTARVSQPLRFSWIVSAPSGQATDVVLTVVLPRGMTAYQAQQSCTILPRTITCQLGTVSAALQQVFVNLRSASRGAKTITGTLTSKEAISDPSKATKSFSVRISR